MKKKTRWSKIFNQNICSLFWSSIELIIWKSIEFICLKLKIELLSTKSLINCISKKKWNEQKIPLLSIIRFSWFEKSSLRTKNLLKKTCDYWHKKTEQNSNQWCLFHVDLDRYHRNRCWMQVYFSHWRNEIFSSVES